MANSRRALRSQTNWTFPALPASLDIDSTFDIKNKMICPTGEDATAASTADAASLTLHALYVFFF